MSTSKTETKHRDRTSSVTKFTDEELAAARERAKELKAQAKRGADSELGLKDVLAKIADMPEADRTLAERIHAIVTKTAPDLVPRTYYGMPAYARDGKIVCFFQPASKFKVRYATLGFETSAKLDDGAMWPTAFAVTKLGAAEKARIAALVKQATG